MTQNNNSQVLELFNSLGQQLNSIGVTPIVYGSLGLYFQLPNITVNDIDFLLPDDVFNANWDKIKKLLVDNKCSLDPDHAQELDCQGIYISFLKLSQVSHLTNINPDNLKPDTYQNTTYLSLTPKQHLEIYQNGLKDPSRRLKKESPDLAKIKLLQNLNLVQNIVVALKQNQNVFLVGKSDSGKTWFVKNFLIPYLKQQNILAEYYKDIDNLEIPNTPKLLIIDEVEILSDQAYLESLHPEEKPFYTEAYLKQIKNWHKKLSQINFPCIYIITRNDDQALTNLQTNPPHPEWSNIPTTTLIYKK